MQAFLLKLVLGTLELILSDMRPTLTLVRRTILLSDATNIQLSHLKFEAATSGDACVGVTLLQTAQTDENGEKFLYYPQKKLEVQAVLTGEAVPVLGKGIVTLDADSAIVGSVEEGDYLRLGAGANAGKVTKSLEGASC